MTITVRRDNDRDLEFVGELIASENSQPESAVNDYSGDVGRWTELRLYLTKSGKYIAAQIGRTRYVGEHDRYSAAVCEDLDDVQEFFGSGWLAKKLYEKAGIEHVENVD